jgi:hypothetical protein
LYKISQIKPFFKLRVLLCDQKIFLPQPPLIFYPNCRAIKNSTDFQRFKKCFPRLKNYDLVGTNLAVFGCSRYLRTVNAKSQKSLKVIKNKIVLDHLLLGKLKNLSEKNEIAGPHFSRGKNISA